MPCNLPVLSVQWIFVYLGPLLGTNFRTFSILVSRCFAVKVQSPLQPPPGGNNQFTFSSELPLLDISQKWLIQCVAFRKCFSWSSQRIWSSAMLQNVSVPHSCLALNNITFGCLHLLAAWNRAAVNSYAHESSVNICFHPSRWILRSGIAGSYSNSTFNILGKYQSTFQCTIENGNILPIYQQIQRIILVCILSTLTFFFFFFF